MSEVAEAPVQSEVTAGTLLRRAREASGLHVAALAVSLKVPVRKLEALEDDRFQDLGDPVFIRALASSVCRTLKVDAQPILERLPQTAAPRLIRDTDGLNEPFRAPGDGPAPSWIDAMRQPVPLAVLALLAGAVVIFLLPPAHIDDRMAAAEPARAPAAPAAAVDFAPAPAAVTASVGSPAAPETAMPKVAALPPAQPAAISPVESPASPGTAPAPASGIVVLRTRGVSWVEVVDAKGAVALRKIMAAGESAGASGALPLTVTVGRVDITDVEVRGKKFDMRPLSKDNVARFEVK